LEAQASLALDIRLGLRTEEVVDMVWNGVDECTADRVYVVALIDST